MGSDDFNRATLNGGTNTYTSIIGTWDILSSTVLRCNTTNSTAFVATNTGKATTDDQYMRAQITLASGADIGIAFCIEETSATNFYLVSVTASIHRLYQYVGGTATLIGQYTRTHTNGDLYEVHTKGSLVEVAVNGKITVSVVNTAVARTSGNRGVGYRARANSNGTTFDNAEWGNYTAAPAAIVRKWTGDAALGYLDDTFQELNPAIVYNSARELEFAGTGTRFARWSPLGLGAHAVTMYFRKTANPATSNSIVVPLDANGNICYRVRLSSTGALIVDNYGGASNLGTTSVLSNNVDYRVEWIATTQALELKVFVGETATQLGSTLTLSSTFSAVDNFRWGQQNSTPNIPTFYVPKIAIKDEYAYIGTITDGAAPTGPKIAIIGDSLTNMAPNASTIFGEGQALVGDALEARGYDLNNVYFWGVGGKKIATADLTGKTFANCYADAVALLGGEPDYTFILLGTNDRPDSDGTVNSAIDTALAEVDNTTEIIWFNLTSKQVASTRDGQVSALIAAKLAAWSGTDYTFADWDAEIRSIDGGSNPSSYWQTGDSTHMTHDGYVERARFMAEQLPDLDTVTVTKTLDVRWDVRAPVTKTAAVVWNVRETVSATLAPRWDVRSTVSTTVSLLWDVRSLAIAYVSVGWDVRALVTVAQPVAWDLREVVAVTRQVSWDIRETTASAHTLEWSIRTEVTRDQDIRWDVESDAPIVVVTKTLDLRWDVRKTTLTELLFLWDVRTTVTRATDIRWDIRVLTQHSLPVAWDLRASVAAGAALAWDVRLTAALLTAVHWSVRALVTRESEIRWDVESDQVPRDLHLTVTPLTSRWATSALEGRWATRALAARYSTTPMGD